DLRRDLRLPARGLHVGWDLRADRAAASGLVPVGSDTRSQDAAAELRVSELRHAREPGLRRHHADHAAGEIAGTARGHVRAVLRGRHHRAGSLGLRHRFVSHREAPLRRGHREDSPMRTHRPIAASLLALLALAGCATTTVTEREPYQGRRLARPDRILVYDFAATTADLPELSAA